MIGGKMKKIFFLIIIVSLAVIPVLSDFKITYESRTEGYYYGGVNYPEEVDEQVIWIGGETFAFVTDARRVVIDLKEGIMALILTGLKKYAVTELPFKLSGVLPDELVKYLAGVETQGNLKALPEKKNIDKYECSVYESSSWILYQGDKVNEIDSRFFVSIDVPLDLVLYEKMNRHLRVLRNYSPAFITELEKLEGIPVLVESYFYPKGFAVKNTSILRSIEDVVPPAGIYTIPETFEKTDKLTMQEFRIR